MKIRRCCAVLMLLALLCLPAGAEVPMPEGWALQPETYTSWKMASLSLMGVEAGLPFATEVEGPEVRVPEAGSYTVALTLETPVDFGKYTSLFVQVENTWDCREAFIYISEVRINGAVVPSTPPLTRDYTHTSGSGRCSLFAHLLEGSKSLGNWKSWEEDASGVPMCALNDCSFTDVTSIEVDFTFGNFVPAQDAVRDDKHQ